MPEVQPSKHTDHELVPRQASLILEENVHLSAEQTSPKSPPALESQADTTSFDHPSSAPKVEDLISFFSFSWIDRLTNNKTCLNDLILSL